MKNETLILVILGAVVMAFLFTGVGFGGYGGMMSMMYGSYGGGMMFFGWIYGILIFVALILLVVWLFKQVQKK
ncbi:MAG: hypothetical protein AABX79_01675 [Nanoarchaeota archaeon]